MCCEPNPVSLKQFVHGGITFVQTFENPNGDGQSLEQLLVKLVLDYVRAANKNALPERTADNESEGGEDDAYEGSKNTSCGWRRKS